MIRSVLYICRSKKKEKEAHHTLHKIACRIKSTEITRRIKSIDGYVFLKMESYHVVRNYTQGKKHKTWLRVSKKRILSPRCAG
jgi:hypothetical protein